MNSHTVHNSVLARERTEKKSVIEVSKANTLFIYPKSSEEKHDLGDSLNTRQDLKERRCEEVRKLVH